MSDSAGPQGREVVEAFHYVRDIYRNVSRILQASDPAMQHRGYRPYGWSAVWTPGDRVTTPEKWGPYWAVRQYYRPETQNREVLTVAAVMWDPKNEEMDTPVLLASRMQVTTTSGPDALWVGLWQHWSMYGSDGIVRPLRVGDESRLAASDVAKAKALLASGALVSVAIPLLNVTSIDVVERRLLDPLLAAPWSLV